MPRRILIVDDLAINRRILGGMLGKEYDILEAADGEQALDVLMRNHESISAVLLDISMPVMDGYEALRQIRAHAEFGSMPVIMITAIEDEEARVKAHTLGANDFVMKPYSSEVIKHCLQNNIALQEAAVVVNVMQRDKLTGLYSREAFFEKVRGMVSAHEPGYYIMACFDIDNFKVINDQYGIQKGDEVLRYIARVFQEGFKAQGGICCRVAADDFAIIYPASFRGTPELAAIRKKASSVAGLIAPITFSIGRYLVNDLSLLPSAMYDRAMLAANSIKGRYDVEIAVYNESLREHLIREQEIVTEMKAALSGNQFEAWFQPQYNHSTDALIGAEALVRWRHPEKGLIPPSAFIPIFEQNGFIYQMDKFIWEQVCRYLRKWTDEGRNPLPVSVNISRHDIFHADFVEVITGLVSKYDLPVDLLRLEITETAFSESTEQIIAVVKELIGLGFTIEIDDFGSGYSSLNTLKDVPTQILKLDMKFIESSSNSKRGGNIVESVVRMAKWLDMSVIAEGVETIEQANFLRSIGCNYMQGYLYACPMPAPDYEALCEGSGQEERLLALETVENLDNNSFWDPESMDTLIFNSYVGGACIYEYHHGNIELLRATEKYAQVIGSAGMTVEDALKLNWAEHLDEENGKRVIADLETSIATQNEVTGEYIFLDLPGCPHETYLHSTMRVIAVAGDRYLVYCTNENITAQRRAEQRERQSAERIQAIMDNVDLGITASVLENGKMQLFFANNKYYELLGYTKAQFEEEIKDPSQTVAPDERHRMYELTLNITVTKEPTVLEYRALRRDGSSPWFRVVASMGRFMGIKSSVLISIFRNITDEKRAEQVLKETEQQLRFLNETAHELLAQPDTDVGINGTLRKLMEYFHGIRAYIFEFDFQNSIATNTYEVCAEGVAAEKDNLREVPLALMHHWLPALEQEGYYAIEDIAALDDSRAEEREQLLMQGIRSLFVVPLYREEKLFGMMGVDDPDRPFMQRGRLGAIGVYIAVMLARRDLNERISSDNKAITSMMADIPDGFVRMRVYPDGSIKPVYFNEGFFKLTGMNYEELMGIYADDALAGVHPDDAHIFNEVIAQMLKNGEAHSSRYRLRHGSGGYIWLMIFGRITEDASGHTFLNIYYTDANEQVKEEEKQKELLDNLPCGAALYEYDGMNMTVVHRNKRYWELVGHRAADYELVPVEDRIHPGDRQVFKRELAAAIEQKRDAACDLRILFKEQEYRPFHVAGRIIPQDNGKYAIYASYTPVSENKMPFRESLPFVLNAIMESSPDLSFAKDREFKYICASRAFAQMAGIENERSLIGKTDFDIFPTAIAEKFRRDDIAIINEGKPHIDMVEPIPSDDGTPRYSNTSKYLLRDFSGQIIGLYGVGRDITKALETDSRLKFLNDNIPGGLVIYAYSEDGLRITYCNEGFCELFGGTHAGFEQRGAFDPLEWVFEEDRPALQKQIAALIRDDATVDCIFRIHVIGGGYKWINEKAVTTERRDWMVIFNAILLDITERQNAIEQLRVSEEENRLAMRHSGSIVCRYTIADRSLTMSPDVAAYYSLQEKILDVPHEPIRRGCISPTSAKAYTEFFEAIIRGDEYPNSTDVEAFLLFEDIDQDKRAESLTLERAETDPLTGLLNRVTFAARVMQKMQSSKSDACHAMLMLDIDGFKQVNNVFGHGIGDQVLIDVVGVLRSTLRRGDILGRLGGDEFLIFISDIPGEVVAANKAKQICALVQKTLSIEVRISGSIGIVMAPRDGVDYETLYKKADSALYYVKGSGKNGYAFYRDDMSDLDYGDDG